MFASSLTSTIQFFHFCCNLPYLSIYLLNVLINLHIDHIFILCVPFYNVFLIHLLSASFFVNYIVDMKSLAIFHSLMTDNNNNNNNILVDDDRGGGGQQEESLGTGTGGFLCLTKFINNSYILVNFIGSSS